jgi:hypothetical protein
MDDNRQNNGRFGAGNNANPHGRPRKDRSAAATILKELAAPVTITENQRRKSISKLAANAKQIANKGASGELRAAKLAVDYALKAERERETAAPPQELTESDRAIVDGSSLA